MAKRLQADNAARTATVQDQQPERPVSANREPRLVAVRVGSAVELIRGGCHGKYYDYDCGYYRH